MATALAAAGAVLLAIAPFLPLAEGAPVSGLRNSLFWRPPGWDWLAFVVAAICVPVALALWDSRSRWRIAGPLLFAIAGTSVTILTVSLSASDIFDHCNWGPEYGLTTGTFHGCSDTGRYEDAQALGTAAVGGTLLLVTGLILPLTATFSPAESERRRRRLRSFSYM